MRGMKVLVQRVTRASVTVEGETVAAIGAGALVLLGVERGDGAELAGWYARKLASMKLFAGDDGLWSRTLGEAGGAVLVVSQFTLAARTRKGRRPSFDPAAPPEQAVPLCVAFVTALRGEGLRVEEGRFGATMQVELVNDGPVTFLLDGPAGGGNPA
jgi:D-tyrosyl-tRNA(Tyr) deacylase